MVQLDIINMKNRKSESESGISNFFTSVAKEDFNAQYDWVKSSQDHLKSIDDVLIQLEKYVDQDSLGFKGDEDICQQTQRRKVLLDTKIQQTEIEFKRLSSNYANWETFHKEQRTAKKNKSLRQGIVKGIVGVTLMTGAATISAPVTSVVIAFGGLVSIALGVKGYKNGIDPSKDLEDFQKFNYTVQEIRQNLESMKIRRESCEIKLRDLQAMI